MSTDRKDHDAERSRPFGELRDEGLLWLINRVCFHPRGYALALDTEEDGTVVGWMMLGDGSECWSFDEAGDDEEFAKVTRYFTEGPKS